MLRKGLDPFERQELKDPVGYTGYTSVSRREVKENPFLATKIVSTTIVGIRSSTEVPRKFLKYFRYRQNFLILVGTYALPIGLVRFLLAQWCINPFSLWLRRSSTLKKFLRKVPILHVKHARDRLTSAKFDLAPAEDGPCTSPSSLASDFESDGEEFLD